MQIDSLDYLDGSIYLGLSNLEGNVWDGCIKRVKANEQIDVLSIPTSSGISMIRHVGNDENTKILTCHDNGCINIYNQDLNFLGCMDDHDDIVTAVSFIQNTGKLYSSSWDGAQILWDINESLTKPISRFQRCHSSQIHDISFHDQSLLLSSVGSDGYARFWDTRQTMTNGCSIIFNINQGGSAIRWSATDSNICYVGTDAGEIKTVDIRNVSNSFSIQSHRQRIRRIATSSLRPGIVISCSDDTTIAITNMKKISFHTMDSHRIDHDYIYRIGVHSDHVTDLFWLESVDGDEDEILSSSFDQTFQKSIIDYSNME